MTRFFGGYGSGGGGYGRKPGASGGRSGSSSSSSAGGKSSETKKSSLSRAMEGRKRYEELKSGGRHNPAQNNEDRYKKILEEKLQAQKAALMTEKKHQAGMKPGSKAPEREMSKSTQMALEMMAERAAKKEMKKQGMKEDDKPVEIKSAYFGGMNPGQLDRKGNLRNAEGKILMKIDPETGEMRTQGVFGRKIGVYDPKSMSCQHKISKLLAEDAAQKAKAKQNTGGSIYSTFNESDNKSSSGNIWGSSDASSFWGNKSDDDNKGGGWW